VFLNRSRELEQLEHWWSGSQPEFITMYGRRQIGKTELLVQFFQNKPAK
jgi:AAA+ ATPase superfamily predicted ATPase